MSPFTIASSSCGDNLQDRGVPAIGHGPAPPGFVPRFPHLCDDRFGKTCAFPCCFQYAHMCLGASAAAGTVDNGFSTEVSPHQWGVCGLSLGARSIEAIRQ
jgi:hypothetical protein